MAAVVHYEVYSYDARGWTLELRYTSAERETAINEAKVLEMTLNRPVRVMRETYYSESNTSEETVTFVGRLKPQAMPTPRRAANSYGSIGGSGSSGFDGGSSSPFQASAQSAKKTADFVFRLIVVLLGSLFVSVAGTGVASMLINRYSTLGVNLPPENNSLILFLIFLSLFLITAIPSVMLYVPLDVILGGGSKKKAPSNKSSIPMDLDKEPTPTEDVANITPYPRLSNPTDVVDAVVFAQQQEEAAQRNALDGNAAEAKAQAEQEAAERTKAEQAKAEEQARAQKQAAEVAQERADKEAIIANLAVGLTEDPPKKKRKKKKKSKEHEQVWEPDEFEPLSPLSLDGDEDEWEDDDDDDDEDSVASGEASGMDFARLVIMKFLGGAVSAIKTTHPQLDAYNKFGVNLYMAGACEFLAEQKKLTPEQRDELVQETVEVIGTRPEQARHLINRLEGYRKEPRYRQMINAGRVAMDRHVSGSGDPFMAIGGIMKDWNTPQAMQVVATSVTILFTDMVGSTDLTQAIGDAAAQDVIRAHNFIVRAALSHHNGKEVKHTGDGIMASFDSPSDAVEAAVEIQQRTNDHNHKWPKLSMGLRIGMNTGEPIIEENDYFGTTVQIAARVCAAAGMGQIWLSADTRALIPANYGMTFHSHGPQRLKGVKAPHELFEAVWNPERTRELERARPHGSAPAPMPTPAMPQPAVAAAPAAATSGKLPTPYSPEETARAREAARQHLAGTRK